jgi:hypothetical protein
MGQWRYISMPYAPAVDSEEKGPVTDLDAEEKKKYLAAVEAMAPPFLP